MQDFEDLNDHLIADQGLPRDGMSTKGDSATPKQLEFGCGKEAAVEVQFFPPLYIQRYSFAVSVLMEHGITSVMDLGCSECGFMQLLPTVPSLERIALVDIDRDLLESKKQVIKPELRHHVFRRCKPLHVSLLAGSAVDMDSRLVDYEAVTMIELVEHLYPDVLDKVVLNVFGRLTPKLCLVTTPNSEFNVLFDNEDPKQYRHWDHKFEWTRKEFGLWCDNICQTYGYSVEYSGVGRLTSRPDTDHFGPCTQAAVFHLLAERSLGELSSQCYELIAESDFPYEKNVLSLEDKIDLEVSYCLRQLAASQKDELCHGQLPMVSVFRLASVYTVKALCGESGVRESLKRSGHRLSTDDLYVILDEDDDETDNGSPDDANEEDCVDDLMDYKRNKDCARDKLHDLAGCVLKVGPQLAGGEHVEGGLGVGSPDDWDIGTEESWDTDCS